MNPLFHLHVPYLEIITDLWHLQLFTFRSQLVRFKKTRQLYFRDWALPPVLAVRVHLTDHLVLGAYNLLHSQNTTLIQTVTHACCHFVIRDEERPSSCIKHPNKIPCAPSNSSYCHTPSYTFHF